MEEYARAVAAHGCTANYGQLVGHGTLRGAVMGFVDRDPEPEEMEQLKDLLERELKAGAFGMSLGLIYPPSAFCKREELVELAKVLKKYDALLTVHMRNEGPRIFQAVDEMIDITRRSGVHLQISHLKLMGKPQWGRSQELLDKIEAARQEGMTITCDQYPYTATSTSMTALLPKWAHDGGVSALVARVKAPDQRLKDETAAEMEDRGGPAHVMVSGTHGYHPEWEGRTVAELAEELRSEPLPLVIVGDGAVLCEKALTESGLPCRLAPPQLVMQNAMSVALCAEDLARAGKLVSAQELLPVYLRPPQAQRLRQPPQI